MNNLQFTIDVPASDIEKMLQESVISVFSNASVKFSRSVAEVGVCKAPAQAPPTPLVAPMLKATPASISTVEMKHEPEPAATEHRQYHNHTEYTQGVPTRLIMFQCDNCGKVVVNVNRDGNFDYYCKECGKEFDWSISDLIPSKSICPNCSQATTFYMPMGNDLKELRCNECYSYVDMEYVEKKKVFQSVNME